MEGTVLFPDQSSDLTKPTLLHFYRRHRTYTSYTI